MNSVSLKGYGSNVQTSLLRCNDQASASHAGAFSCAEKSQIPPEGALHFLRVKVDPVALQPLRIRVSSVQQVGQISG